MDVIKSEAEPSRQKSALAKQAWERPSSLLTGGSALKQSTYEAESGPSLVMEPAFTLILEFSAPITVKKYISAVQMLLGLWYLLQQPRRNKTASDSGSQCLTIIAMDITKQRKRVKAGSWGCFIFTGLISDIFVLGGT